MASHVIANADAFIILTGAGMGVDSGLPTFRGPTAKGWTHSKTGVDIDYYDICQGEIYEGPDHPLREEAELFWQDCEKAYSEAIPHEGYDIIMRWVKNKPYFVFTTNVDCHWTRVGVPESQLLEIHGSVRHYQCCNPGPRCSTLLDWGTKTCPSCGGLTRPNILMFKDAGYMDEHKLPVKEAYQKFITDHHTSKVVILVIGAGMTVPTIQAEVSMLKRRLQHTNEVRINPDVKDFYIRKGALAGLRDLDQEITPPPLVVYI